MAFFGVSPCLDWYSQQPFELKSGADAWPALAPNPPTNGAVGEFKLALKLSLRPVSSSQSLTEQFLPVHDSALVPKRTGVKWLGFGGVGFGDIARVWPCLSQIKA